MVGKVIFTIPYHNGLCDTVLGVQAVGVGLGVRTCTSRLVPSVTLAGWRRLADCEAVGELLDRLAPDSPGEGP